MRLLYITNGFPFPLTSGYLRHYFLIRELSARHSITLLSLVKDGFQREHIDALRPFTEQVQTFSKPCGPQSLLKRTLRDVRFLVGSDPGVVAMRTAIRNLTRREHFDAAVFSGKETVPVLQDLDDLPVVADICDAASVRYRGRLQHAGPLERPRLLLGQALVRRVEQRIIRRADHVVFASHRDREALVPNGSRRATVIPNGVDVDFWRRSEPLRGRDTIVFTGAMNYRPNVDAAMCLIEKTLPLVRKVVPNAKLLIVGRDPTGPLAAAGKRADVTVTGFVDDVRPYLERATVFAAPLRFGAGIQNKVLEAMAMEVPVIASPLAAAGLRTADGAESPIEVAGATEEFVDAVLRQFKSARVDATPDQAAREYVQQHFVWQRSAELLEEVLTRVAGQVATKRPAAAASAG